MQLHIRHARDNTAKRGRRKRKTDCGGGIDIGKAVAAVATNGRSSWDYAALETRPYEEVTIPPLLPIAVPTTIRAATRKCPDGGIPRLDGEEREVKKCIVKEKAHSQTGESGSFSPKRCSYSAASCSRKLGCAMVIRRRARSRSVWPRSCATPYSVTI